MDFLEGLARVGADLVPGANFALDKLMPLVRDEHKRRTSRALAAACSAAGLKHEELQDAIVQNPAIFPLFIRVLAAAGMSGQDHVLDLIGSRLGQGLNNQEALLEQELLVLALDGLTDAHVDALNGFVDLAPNDPGIRQANDNGVGQFVISALAAKGLITGQLLWSGTQGYVISELGRAVVDASRSLR